MGKKKTPREQTGKGKGGWTDSEIPLNNPFAALGGLKLKPVEAPEPSAEDAPPAVEPPAPAAPEPSTTPGPARAVLRLERKGRGGKTVTMVTHLGLEADALDVWCKALRKGLGCGGQVEGDSLVFNGDHRDRLAALLEGRGVRKVTRG